MKLAIVILNWNGQQLLETFLPSVVDDSDGHSIYVIDNASTDTSVSFLETHFPKIHCIKLDSNFGYAAGYNKGLEQINADIFCLLNSDVEVTKNWLKPILNTFKTEINTVIIQPKILDYHQKNKFEYAGAGGGFIDQLGYPYCRGRIFETLEEDRGQYNDQKDIFWASGACLFIRAKTFKELRGFDSNFFSHMEEIDLCWRAKNRGLTVTYVGTSTVYHVGGASLKSSHPKKTFLNFRNSLFTLVKNSSKPLLVVLLLRLVLDGIAGLRFLLQAKPKHIIAIIKAHGSFYISLPYLLQFRNQHSNRKSHQQIPSIVWSYFVRNNKYFNKL
ncbi:MAG: glycosyltransferase family 2 protein [Flavobacteriaceae bacterium]|nr:glycosyltransferase family 2 protein [Formosa sp.]MDG2499256.1 glycosyltransferase family 2 protein [Flavobacteriaceae bacterium]